ncbi:unnamed protein product [Paramecium sonneborni]|uniref:Protein kinase-like domain n=1 Tax=Paramecium sonneborni TaxID=65129 RepID=A0A8S1QM96_9CILI|nr:unnamed protein product [Paramecium sonneborni]
MSKTIGVYTFNTNELIGKGTLGNLHKGVNKTNGQVVVLRLLQKSLLKDSNIISAALTEEMAIMQKIQHPKINPILDVIESQTYFYVVFPFKQSNLQTILQKQKKLPEAETIKLISDLIEGFQELIKTGVIHRDLKPSNILYDNGSYIISDPGFIKTIESFKKEKTKPEKFQYSAPQLLGKEKTKYTDKCDIWSLGVIVYECLTGMLPFQASNIEDYLKQCRNKKIEFQQGQISAVMKSFIEGCLVYQEEKRFDWAKVVSHPIVNAKLQNKNEVFKDNKKYLMTQIRQKIIKKNLDLEAVYNEIDADHNELLDLEEFTQFIKKIDKKVSEEDCTYIFKQIDKDGSDSISFDEFKQWISGNNTKMAFFKINKPNNKQTNNQQPKNQNQNQFYQPQQQPQNQIISQLPQQQQMNNYQQPFGYQQLQQQPPQNLQQGYYQQQQTNYQQQLQFNQYPINQNVQKQQQFQPQPQPQQMFPQTQMQSSGQIPAGAGFGKSDKLERTILMITNVIKSKQMDVLNLFQQFDYDKDNFLNFQEFSQLIWSLNGQLTVEEMADLFKVFNLNSDEYVSFVEFRLVASMANNKKQNVQPQIQPQQPFFYFPNQPQQIPPFQIPTQQYNVQNKGNMYSENNEKYPFFNEQFYSPYAQPNNQPALNLGNNANKSQKKNDSQLEALNKKQSKKDVKKKDNKDNKEKETKKRQSNSFSPKEEKPKQNQEQPMRPPKLTQQDKQKSILETPKYPTEVIGSQNKTPSPHPSPRQDKRKIEQPTVTYQQPEIQEENLNYQKSAPHLWYQQRYLADYIYNTNNSKLDQELAESTNLVQTSSIPNFNNKPYRKVLDDKIDKFYYYTRR